MSAFHETPLGKAMLAKDPALVARLSSTAITNVREEWCKVYPEDFPLGGMTRLVDASAIKPKEEAEKPT